IAAAAAAGLVAPAFVPVFAGARGATASHLRGSATAAGTGCGRGVAGVAGGAIAVAALAAAQRPARTAQKAARRELAVAYEDSGIDLLDNGKFAQGLVGAEGAWGRFEFDPLGFSTKTEVVPYLREAELKHGRLAMLAWVGMVVPDFVRLPGEKFSFEAVPVSIDAHEAFRGASGVNAQILFWISIVELCCAKKVFEWNSLEVAGDYGLTNWFPSDEEGQKKMRLSELKNGRLAMLAFAGAVTQAALTRGGAPQSHYATLVHAPVVFALRASEAHAKAAGEVPDQPAATSDLSSDGYGSYDLLATVAAAGDRMAPLGRVQAIFDSQQKDLNSVWDDMRDKVCHSLMPGRPQQATAGIATPTSCANSACSSRTPAAKAPPTVAHGELVEAGHMREHACWLWSRLGSSLMSLADRNAWLEDENKRLRQELEELSHSIKKAEEACDYAEAEPDPAGCPSIIPWYSLSLQATKAGQLQRMRCTHIDAAMAKASCAKLGYFQDNYTEQLIKQRSQCKSPLIHRGYWSRVEAIRKTVTQFLRRAPSGPVQIVNLGAGFDTIYFWLREDSTRWRDDLVYFEVDFPEVLSKKISAISKRQGLWPLLDVASLEDLTHRSSSGMKEIRTKHCRLIQADMRIVPEMNAAILDAGFRGDVPTLFMAECVLVYMQAMHGDGIIAWASSSVPSAPSAMVMYEQTNPHDRFGKVMVQNLAERGCPLLSVFDYPSMDAQKTRFLDRGWNCCSIADMNEIYSRHLDQKEVERIHKIELMDEFEEPASPALQRSGFAWEEPGSTHLQLCSPRSIVSHMCSLSVRPLSN
ncbi:LCMT1, partial [Symbiodinium pilosum]